ncbi:hypothetical protein Q3G72_012472 [Acer saccharum]|nr:hypothetical protein Q3G72_012472 [Acer saccharum]
MSLSSCPSSSSSSSLRDVWLPNAPKVQKPRSVFNAAALAYIGDCIYKLFLIFAANARRHFLFLVLSIEEYNDRVTAVERCEAQDTLLQKLLEDDYLSAQKRYIYGSEKAECRASKCVWFLRKQSIKIPYNGGRGGGGVSNAISILTEVVMLNPCLPDTYHTLGLVYDMRAAESYGEIVQLCPENVEALNTGAKVLP